MRNMNESNDGAKSANSPAASLEAQPPMEAVPEPPTLPTDPASVDPKTATRGPNDAATATAAPPHVPTLANDEGEGQPVNEALATAVVRTDAVVRPTTGRLASPDACIELAAASGKRRAVLVAEGPIRDMADGRGRYTFTAQALQEAVIAGRFNGLACFLDHGQTHPTMRDYVGVWDAAALKALPDGRLAAAAELTVHNPDLVRHVFAALAEPDSRRPDIGVSIVCYPQVAGGSQTIHTGAPRRARSIRSPGPERPLPRGGHGAHLQGRPESGPG